jgi:hypothetical protein
VSQQLKLGDQQIATLEFLDCLVGQGIFCGAAIGVDLVVGANMFARKANRSTVLHQEEAFVAAAIK